MRTLKISEQEFKQIVQKDENHFFDFKSKQISGKALQKIVVALGNADGGEVIIGIEDSKNQEDHNNRWDGFDEIESMNSLLQAVFELSPSANVLYECIVSEIGKGYLLRINIEKSSHVLKTADNTVYVRKGAQSLPLKDPQKIQELSFSKGNASYEDRIIKELATEAITESTEIKVFLADYSPKTDALEFIINQNLVDFKSWEVKTVAALMFHENPSTVIATRCAVKITRYETREEDPERDHLAEQITLEGSLNNLIIDTVKSVTDLMSRVTVWTSDGYQYVRYPPEAIWETIVNALIHRDYSIADDVQIYIFDNRIEVRSPGKLPGYVTLENILDARFSRNPKIVRTLNRYKDAPNKDLGEGLNTTFQKMKEFGLKDPLIFEDGNYLVVQLPHTPLASPGDSILKFLEKNETITNKQAREITGIKSENSVKAEFYKLRDRGLLEQVPELKGPKSAWRKP